MRTFVRFNNYSIALLTIGMFAILVAACGKNEAEDSQKKGVQNHAITVEAFRVSAAPFATNFSTSGTLMPNEEVDITPEITGRITHIYFKEGQAVRRGQILVKLLDKDFVAQKRKLEAQKQLQMKLLNRQKELLGIGGISQQDFENTQTQIKSYDADIAIIQTQIEQTNVRAPFSGKIGLRNVSVGAVVDPTTVIARLQQTSPLKVDFTIPDQYRSALEPHTEIQLVLKTQMDTLTGKISALDAGSDPITRNLNVRAIVQNNNGQLGAGAYVQVIVPLSLSQNALLIPSNVVIPTTREKVVPLVKNGVVEMRTVELGERTASGVQVLRGLSAGDTVLTTGIVQARNGLKVNISKLHTDFQEFE